MEGRGGKDGGGGGKGVREGEVKGCGGRMGREDW